MEERKTKITAYESGLNVKQKFETYMLGLQNK